MTGEPRHAAQEEETPAPAGRPPVPRWMALLALAALLGSGLFVTCRVL